MKNKMIYALFLVSLLLSGCGSTNQLSSSYEDGIYYRPNKEKQSARLAAQEELDRLHYSKYNRNTTTDTLYFDEDGVVNIDYKPGEQYLIYEDGISYEERIRKFEDPDYTINITFDTWDYAWYNPWWGTYRYHSYYGYNSWLYGWGNPWYVGGYYGWYDPWYYDWYWGFGGYYGWYDPWYHNWWHGGFYPHYPGYHPHPGGPGHKPDWGINNNNFIYGKRGEEASYRRVNSTSGRRDVAVSGSTSTGRRTDSREGYSSTSYRRGSSSGNSGVRATTSTSRRGSYSTSGTSRDNSTTIKSSGTSTSRSRSNSSYSRSSSSNSSSSSYSRSSSSSRGSYSGSSSSSRSSYSGSSSSSSSSRSSGGSGGRR